ncbi:MAG: metal ABC transporter substrate-binding protein [Candidatus Nanopelagicales bacterium]
MGMIVNKGSWVRRSVCLLACGALLAGCAGGVDKATADSKVKVVAAVYPLTFLAEQVGGASVEVTTLTPPGVEPHDLELSATQVIALKEADLILSVPGMAAIDQAVAQNNPDAVVDLTAGLDLLPLPGESQASAGEYDPHVWLDPANMSLMGQTVGAAIGKADPSAEPAVARGIAALTKEMKQLDADYSAGTKTCRSRDLIVTHDAFGYLARAYDFVQYGLTGISPESEPSPARLAEIAKLVEQGGITTIYFEVLVSPRVAETVAAETGAKTAILDPIEGNTDDLGYEALMRANLETLRVGQGCS